MIEKNIRPYNILEMANAHGGNINYIYETIDEFKKYNENTGIKFHPLHHNALALQDYEWYETYKKLLFNNKEWTSILKYAKKSKDVWIEVCDTFSVQIIKENIDIISGLKLQSSVIQDAEIIQQLEKLNLKNIILIINISGIEINDILKTEEKFKSKINPKEIVFQIGFQDYPTETKNCGLQKIKFLKNNFKNRISYADHSDGKSFEAVYLPILSFYYGAIIIEKHIMHSKKKTLYDYFSSINIKQYDEYFLKSEYYFNNNSLPSECAEIDKSFEKENFINSKEKKYLTSTLHFPISKRDIYKGSLINLKNDISFKRTNQNGIDLNDLEKISRYSILNNNIKKNKTFKKNDFKKAKIVTVIACRMKSSRLLKKATIKIGKLSSIELCIKNCLTFQNIDSTILATSTLEEDSELKNHTYDKSVHFYKGSPDDVIERYINAIDSIGGADIVVRVTGDMQYVSNDILQVLLKSHFKNGADFTKGREATIGTNLEIYNFSALKKIKKYFKDAYMSEYMTYYILNNPDYFKINFVDLPSRFVRDYRLTLDYLEDLILFKEIESFFSMSGKEYSLQELYKFLDSNPDIAKINKNCEVKYIQDKLLINKINKATTIKKVGI